MGNQPSRRNTGRRTSHSRKFVSGINDSLKNKNFDKAAKIALGAGLQGGGEGVLAASILAAAKAYSSYKENKSKNISIVSSDAVKQTVDSYSFKLTKEGRSTLRTSISTALSGSEQK